MSFLLERKKSSSEMRKQIKKDNSQGSNREYDSRIVKVPINMQAKEGEKCGSMLVRVLPNKAPGQKNLHLEDGTWYSKWYVKRSTHRLKRIRQKGKDDFYCNFDCPCSLPKSDVTDISASKRKEIRETVLGNGISESTLAKDFSLDVSLINRIRHEKNPCPICEWNKPYWESDKLKKNNIYDIGSGLKHEYYSWAMILEVNGSKNHEWVDGKPRIIRYPKTIWEMFESELEDSTFFEPVNVGEDGCEGKNFLFSVVMGNPFPNYEKGKLTSCFEDDPTTLIEDKDEYMELSDLIEPLEDVVLRNPGYNTYEDIQKRFNEYLELSDREPMKGGVHQPETDVSGLDDDLDTDPDDEDWDD